MKNIIIFGTGRLADFLLFHLKRDKLVNVVAVTQDSVDSKEELYNGLPVVAFDEIDRFFSSENHEFIVAVGYNKMNKNRASICEKVKRKGYSIYSYISPNAIVDKTVKFGEGAIVFDNNIIEPFVSVGDYMIMWGGGYIAHNSVVKNNVFFGPRVAVAGYSIIGNNCFLGIGSIVRDQIELADFTLIGAGVVVLASTNPYDVFRANQPVNLPVKSVDVL